MQTTNPERPLFSEEGVTVTTARITAGPDTLFIRQVSSVSQESKQLRATNAGRGWLCAAAGILAMPFVMAITDQEAFLAGWQGPAILAAGVAIGPTIAIFVVLLGHLTYRVPVIVTKSDGKRESFWFANAETAKQARRAIEQAVLSQFGE